MCDMLFLSIITPTYNRANLLSACYASLCQQTDLDFEWIVIDDGSTDDTEAVAGTFKPTASLCSIAKKTMAVSIQR